MTDYSEFLLEIRQYLKAFENHMNERNFKEAQVCAESVLVEARLLCLTVKEKAQE